MGFYFSAIRLFSSSRQTVKLDRDGNEELWLEKTYYTTEEDFPTLLRRSEIISSESLEISPVEIALQDVELKNKELDALNRRYSALVNTNQVISTNPLSMTLNSVVDAPMGSGVSSYRAAYLTPEYVERYSERVETVEKLRAAVDNQVSRYFVRCLLRTADLCQSRFSLLTAASDYTA
jgi:dedicator of cytokinesis protein 3